MKEELRDKLVRDGYEDPYIVSNYSRDSDKGLWKAEEKLIQRYFPKEGDVLDIGCGAGRTSIALTQIGYRVIGIDLSARMVKEAKLQRDRLGLMIDFQHMDARTLDFADQSFNCALFSFNGIDDVPGNKGKIEVLREVFRVLRPGAPFIFSAHRIWEPYYIRKFIWSGLKMSFGRIIHLNTLEREWWEFYDLKAAPLKQYHSAMSSGRWKRALLTAGFDFVLNESRYSLESRSLWELRLNLGYSKLIHYVSRNFMFFVARKPCS